MIIDIINPLSSRQVWPNEILVLPIGPPLRDGQDVILEWERSDGHKKDCFAIFDKTFFSSSVYNQLHALVTSVNLSDFGYKVALMCDDNTCATCHVHCKCEINRFSVVTK